MTLLKIARMGHPILSRVADPVADPGAPAVKRLVDDMIETMLDAPGTGLAAPQVHVPLRVVVFFVSPQRAGQSGAEHDTPLELTAMINPEIVPLDAEKADDFEGCLSIPRMIGRVPRFKKIRYSYWTCAGVRVARVAEGFHARVVQHECDHLDAILYPQRIEDLRSFGFVEEVMRARSSQDGNEASNPQADGS
ncbi:peptide deformylase [Varunaivibrio sulfuroxidans]|nr:peptide deformylase [Varunaivibrio sulfuroxidans]WES31861.1 peptide deformylase [Varunaivibrio sulfuroxidans]